MASVDWRVAIELVAPGSEYGWLPSSEDSKIDILGKYSDVDWRDAVITKPTENELQIAWDVYIIETEWNGIQEESNLLIVASDPYVAVDVKLKGQGKNDIDAYRLEVRFKVEDSKDAGLLPSDVVWPSFPNVEFVK